MRHTYVIQKNEVKQDTVQWNYELERFYKDSVFCPMCEVWHENNTWCQANLNDFHGGK